jgi:cellulose synthase/poly-beta-1,6-N-acetylglucosamine synthase-like glycosyltransferase
LYLVKGVPLSIPLLKLRQTDVRPRHTADVPAQASLLGDLLVRNGHLAPDDLTRALVLQTRESARLGDILVGQGMASRAHVHQALATQYRLQLIDLERHTPDPRLISLVDPSDCLALSFIPWRQEGGTVVLATAHPEMIRIIQRKLPPQTTDIRFVLADKAQIHRTIHTVMGTELIKKAEARVDESMSCRTWSTKRSITLVIKAILVAALALYVSTVGALTLIYVIAVTTLFLNTTLKTICAVIALFRRHVPRGKTVFRHETDHNLRLRLPKISILVPLFQEESIAAVLVKRLEKIDYPRELLELCLVVETDDMVTRRTLRNASLPDWMRIIRVPQGALKTKPRAMNYALDFTTGSIINVYDAEDAPDPMQLHKVVRKFRDGGPDLACVQGILSFYNGHKNWLSRCFSFEYAGWFRVMLPGLQRLGFAIPLGGTTLFFRRNRLLELGAWDAHNVTEDADLGMRLARKGYRCEMVDSITQEEANSRLWPWVKQRSRWLKGYAITWCVHMRDPRQLWRDLGPWKFLGFQLLFMGTLVSFFIAPVLWWGIVTTLTAWPHPLIDLLTPHAGMMLMAFFLTCEALSVMLFAIAAVRLDKAPNLAWLITLPIYFVFGTIALYKGLWELLVKPFYWDKTSHGIDASDGSDLSGVDLETGLVGDGQVVAQSS